jgi:hypothetical protein
VNCRCGKASLSLATYRFVVSMSEDAGINARCTSEMQWISNDKTRASRW